MNIEYITISEMDIMKVVLLESRGIKYLGSIRL